MKYQKVRYQKVRYQNVTKGRLVQTSSAVGYYTSVLLLMTALTLQ